MRKEIIGLILFITIFIPFQSINAGIIPADQQCIDENGNQLKATDGTPGSCDLDQGYSCITNIVKTKPKAGYCKRYKDYPQNSSSTIENVFGKIQAPSQLNGLRTGSAGLSDFLSRIITIIYSVASVAVIFMILQGAFQIITSGGDKEKVSQARNRITYAIIGLVLLALAFVIIRVVGALTGFNLFHSQLISTPPCTDAESCNSINPRSINSILSPKP